MPEVVCVVPVSWSVIRHLRFVGLRRTAWRMEILLQRGEYTGVTAYCLELDGEIKESISAVFRGKVVERKVPADIVILWFCSCI